MSQGSRAAELQAIAKQAKSFDQRFERIVLMLDKELLDAAQQGHSEYDLRFFRVSKNDGELNQGDLWRILDHLEAQGFKISYNRVVSWEGSENEKT